MESPCRGAETRIGRVSARKGSFAVKSCAVGKCQHRCGAAELPLRIVSAHAPKSVCDLPVGGQRPIRRADGYVATLVAIETAVAVEAAFENGARTGASPGRFIRVGSSSKGRHPGANLRAAKPRSDRAVRNSADAIEGGLEIRDQIVGILKADVNSKTLSGCAPVRCRPYVAGKCRDQEAFVSAPTRTHAEIF